MVSRIILLLLAAAATSRAGIDFTPSTVEVQFEGVRAAQPGFYNGSTFVTFSPPGGWDLQGAGPELKLTPRNSTFAAAKIETRAPGDAVASAECLKSCQTELAALLPREATGLKWEEPEMNPVLLNRHETSRIELAWNAFGQSFRGTLIVCNLADQQLRFILTARDQDFAKLYDSLRRSLYTWQGLK